MVNFPKDLLDRIKFANRIEDLVSESVNLKGAGNERKGDCPFCEGKRGLSVSVKKQLFRCFKCGVSGIVFQWLQERHGMSFPQAVKELAKRAGIPLPDGDGNGNAQVFKRKPGKKKPNGTGLTSNSNDVLPVSGEGHTTAQQGSELNEGHTTAQQGSELNEGHTTAQQGSELNEGHTTARQGSEVIVGFPGGQPDEEVDSKDADKNSSDHSASRSSRSTDWPDGLNLLLAFHSQITLSDQDEKMIWEKRGLPSKVQHALGFRSNPASNKDILEQVSQPFSVKARQESGLWKWKKESRTLQTNAQYHGWGLENRSKDSNGKDQEKWSWTHPILIPYFDAELRMVGLRPHKGGPPTTDVVRPRLYVPRDHTQPERIEKYTKVIVTEGEFKAAAVWSVLGDGCLFWEPNYNPLWLFGICAVPGISMWNNVEVWHDIYEFITMTECREVYVIFDNEQKPQSTPPKKANDALKNAIGLASRLEMECEVKAFIGMIPDKYRDRKGKADLDGLLNQVLKSQIA